MISQPGAGGENMGVRQARAEAMTDSSVSQNLLRRPLTWVWSMPASAPELLERDERHAERRRAAEHAPAVAMAVDDQLRVRAQHLHRGQPDGVHADHQARAAAGDEVVVAAQHLVDVAGEVGGVHDCVLPVLVAMVDSSTSHHGGDARFERAVRAVGLQLVILDEVDAGFGENAHLLGRCLGRHADGGLDDGADQRPAVDAGECARARDAELRALVRGQERRRKREVEQLEAAEGFELGEIAGDGGEEIGQRWPMLWSGQESVTSAVRRMPSQLGGGRSPGRLGVAAGSPSSMDSTRAA